MLIIQRHFDLFLYSLYPLWSMFVLSLWWRQLGGYWGSQGDGWSQAHACINLSMTHSLPLKGSTLCWHDCLSFLSALQVQVTPNEKKTLGHWQCFHVRTALHSLPEVTKKETRQLCNLSWFHTPLRSLCSTINLDCHLKKNFTWSCKPFSEKDCAKNKSPFWLSSGPRGRFLSSGLLSTKPHSPAAPMTAPATRRCSALAVHSRFHFEVITETAGELSALQPHPPPSWGWSLCSRSRATTGIQKRRSQKELCKSISFVGLSGVPTYVGGWEKQ